jgi:hypothetical protein
MDKNETMFDRRVVERNLLEGLYTRADFEKHIKALPDVAAKADWVDTATLAPRNYARSVMGVDGAAVEGPGDKTGA